MTIKKLPIFNAGLLAVTACLLLGMASIATAQTFQVSGKVINAKNQNPLVGVSILEEGTQHGTTTNTSGEFSLTVSGKNASLRFSYIGFKTKTVDVNGRSNITVTLQSSVANLNQLVVTALGIKRQKKSLGYSVSEVKPENIVSATATNTASLLSGQVAGVKVRQTSGGPGSATRVTIRGVSSFNGNNQPLYVVDGVPIDNSTFTQSTEYGGVVGGDGISMINPKDIKNISVLKGASAAALYGSRARNGVVLITTKSGKALPGKGPQVEISSTVTSTSLLSSFTDYQTKYGQGSGGLPPQSSADAELEGLSSWGAPYSPDSSVSTYFGTKVPYVYHGNQAENFYRNAISTKNSVTLSGGTDRSTYYFNTSYLFTPSVFPNSNLKRTNITLRGTHDFLNNKLHADVKANFIRQSQHNRNRLSDSPGNANYSVFFMPGNLTLQRMKEHMVKDDGTEWSFDDAGSQGFVENPWWVVKKYSRDSYRNRFIGMARISYDFTSWLSVIGRTGIDTYRLRRTPIFPWGTTFRQGGQMTILNTNVLENDTDLMLKLNHAITSSIDVDATFGVARDFSKNETIGSQGLGFKVPGLRTISNFSNVTPVYAYSSKQINSIYGMVQLSYNDYLFITGTGRNDWSSTLPEANNSYFYPSVSGSFVFSEAFSSIMPKWLTFGKIRASWAQVGSDTSPYQLQLTYSLLSNSVNDQSLAVVTPANIPLSSLKPTKTNSVEVGLHMAFVNNRASIDLALYKRKTVNQILSAEISRTSGYRGQVINAGRLDNKGIEVTLTGEPIRNKDASWNTGINFAADRSFVKRLTKGINNLVLAKSRIEITTVNAMEGHRYGVIRGYKFKRDDNGNKILDDQGLPERVGPVPLGVGVPKWTAGWNNTIHYKNWALNFLIGVTWGGQIYSATNATAWNLGLAKQTLIGRGDCAANTASGHSFKKCWTPKGVVEVTNANGDVTGYKPNTTKTTPATYYGQIGTQISEPFVYDDNFIKLRQAKLSYSLPQSVISKTPIHSLTISIVGRNLLYIYNSVPNIDPESAINAGNAQGLELAGMPGTRSIGVNVDIKF